jgi:hypothetical protein
MSAFPRPTHGPPITLTLARPVMAAAEGEAVARLNFRRPTRLLCAAFD